MPNLDIVSAPIAERLRDEAGYPQNLGVGDYYWATFGGESWPALVTSKTLAKNRDRLSWGLPPIKRGPKLPSRRDLELALGEMGYVFFDYIKRSDGWGFAAEKPFQNHAVSSRLVVDIATTPADAVALAYLEAKRREQ